MQITGGKSSATLQGMRWGEGRLETGVWWGVHFDADTQDRIRSHVPGRRDLSI